MLTFVVSVYCTFYFLFTSIFSPQFPFFVVVVVVALIFGVGESKTEGNI